MMISVVRLLAGEICKRLLREDGQDLVEYALMASLVSLGAVAGMSSFAGAVNNAFLGVAQTFQGAI